MLSPCLTRAYPCSTRRYARRRNSRVCRFSILKTRRPRSGAEDYAPQCRVQDDSARVAPSSSWLARALPEARRRASSLTGIPPFVVLASGYGRVDGRSLPCILIDRLFLRCRPCVGVAVSTHPPSALVTRPGSCCSAGDVVTPCRRPGSGFRRIEVKPR